MSGFTQKEVEYLREQRLGRLATVSASGRPHVVPVGFRVDPELGVVDIRGRDMGRTKKFRDVAQTGRAAFVVDDVLRSTRSTPWRARGVEIRGRAEVSGDESIRIFPERMVGWGIDPDASGPNARSASR
jgi:pyridoxamine 5'-phosphate oxidase family protein